MRNHIKIALFREFELRFLKILLSLSLVFHFTVLLAAPHGGHTFFYILFICGVLAATFRLQPNGISIGSFLYQYWPFHLAMISPLIALLICSTVESQWVIKNYEADIRLALFPIISWVLLSLSFKQLRISEWGYVLASVLSVILMYLGTDGGTTRDQEIIGGTMIILFSNLSLTLGILTLISIRYNTKKEYIQIAIKVIAGICALYCSFLSQTRGGWLALPFFAILGIIAIPKIRTMPKVWGIAAIFVIISAISLNSSLVKERLKDGRDNIVQYTNQTNQDTSLGIRLQLWKGTLLLIKEHPFFGIHPENVKHYFHELEERQVITPMAAGYIHSHNDILNATMTLGIAGFISIMCLYIIPGIYLGRYLTHPDKRLQTNSYMGMAVIMGFFIFGLTDTFFWGKPHTFYCVALAILFAQQVRLRTESHSQE